jgi:hypothetical protein
MMILYTWGKFSLVVGSTLTLFVLLVGLAIDIYTALSSDHVTVSTHLLDCSLHFETSR